eukprot:COSAG01_NODE_9600_length_2394_cov_2.019608_1_plen_60_part_00
MEQCGGYAALRQQSFFRNFDWQALREGRLAAPLHAPTPTPLPLPQSPKAQAHPLPTVEE